MGLQGVVGMRGFRLAEPLNFQKHKISASDGEQEGSTEMDTHLACKPCTFNMPPTDFMLCNISSVLDSEMLCIPLESVGFPFLQKLMPECES